MARKKPYMMEWYGSDVLLQELEKAGGNVQEAISKAVDESFNPIRKDLHEFTGSKHKKTGATESNYTESNFYKWTNAGNLNIKVGYDVTSGGEAAIFLQVGTPKMQPYFFITSALHDNLSQVIEAQQKALERVVNDMLSKIPKEK